jgi:hypothetical protein
MRYRAFASPAAPHAGDVPDHHEYRHAATIYDLSVASDRQILYGAAAARPPFAPAMSAGQEQHL